MSASSRQSSGKPGFVGISFLFSGFMQTAMDYARTVKQTDPSLKIMTGGIHATTYPKKILSFCHDFDYIALGEGEPQMVEMAKRIASGTLGNLREIKSFCLPRPGWRGACKPGTGMDQLRRSPHASLGHGGFHRI
jgi:radical SAM superfamily enzyme YgiQ (UPF0313 family)